MGSSLKERFAEIIRFANPAEDDYHTWVRSAEDVLSFPELESEFEDCDELTPDYTREDYEKALGSGFITVYSSKDIKTGTFVSPSRMEAEAYSATGEVSEKRVKVGEVAWVDALQGQYIGNGEFTDRNGFQCRVINGNCHVNLKGEPSTDYIRYSGVSAGNGGYDPSKVMPVKNDTSSVISKPVGGVWMSPSDSPWGWGQWCKQEGMDEWAKNPERLQVKGARILHVYTPEQIYRLPGSHINEHSSLMVDWERISRDYDAFEFHLSQGKGLYNGLYGWDCDTLVVFNADMVSAE